MKKSFCSIIAALAMLSFAGIASAVPATDDMSNSVRVLEGQDQVQKPAQKPVKKQVRKHKKAHKKQGVRKQAAPASSEAPASSGSQASPATK